MSIKDWEGLSFQRLATGPGKSANRTLGDKAAHAMGGGFQTRMIPMPNGDTMMVRTRNGFPEYTIIASKSLASKVGAQFAGNLTAIATAIGRLSSLYMSSGAYIFGPLGGINTGDPSLTIEPVLRKMGAVTGMEATLVPHYTMLPPNDGEVSKLYNLERGGLNEAKLVMYNTRPSMFSGLMRRWVQGQYGSGNTDLMSGPADVDEVGAIPLDSRVAFGYAYGGTTGVVRLTDTYYLVSLSGTTTLNIKAYKINIPTQFLDIMAGLSGTAREGAETLALAHATAATYDEVDLGTWAMPAGVPWYHSWAFSETTGIAEIVINNDLGYNYDRRMYTHLRITFSGGENSISADVITVEQVDGWLQNGQSSIWAPLGTETKWRNKKTTTPDPTVAQNTPVHLFCIKDEFKVVRYKFSKTYKAYDATNWSTKWQVANAAVSIFGEGAATVDVSEEYGNTKTFGFYINGAVPVTSDQRMWHKGAITAWYLEPPPVECNPAIHGGSSRSNCFFTWYLHGSGNTGGEGTTYSTWLGGYSWTVNPYVDPRPGNHWYRAHITPSRCTVSQSYSTSPQVRNHVVSLVIPDHDCAAVYIGSRITDTGNTYSWAHNPGSYGYLTKSRVDEWLEVVTPVYNPNGSVNHYEHSYPVWYGPVMGQASPGFGWNSGATTGSSDPSAKYTHEIKLYGKDELIVGTVDSPIFHPSLIVDKLPALITATSGNITGEIRYDKNALDGSESDATGGYPNDITLFVGAS